MPEICLLGTGGMMPLKDRFLTGLYAEFNGKAVLIDCGEGMQVAFGKHGLKMSRIEAIFITHAHADHITGLPGLLLSLGNASDREKIDIYFPEKAGFTIKSLLYACGGLPFDVWLHGLPEDSGSSVKLTDIDPLLTVNAVPLKHSVPCLGYSLVLDKKPVFAPEKAKELGVPVEFWKRLHSGESVTLDDGRVINQEDVTAEKRKSLKISYVTDTLPIEEIVGFVKNSDLLVCEGMYGDREKKKSMNEKGHMLMQDACEIAVKSGSERLWLTHYSPAEKSPEIYEEELKNIFENTVISCDGMKISL